MGAAARQRAAERQRLAKEWDHASDGDRAWFSSNPGRETRIRRATDEEMEFQRTRNIIVPRLAPGVAWFCIVKQIVPSIRRRLFISFWADSEVDVSEETAALFYGRALTDAETEFETDIRNLLSANGRSVH